jgi:hypothetical protein
MTSDQRKFEHLAALCDSLAQSASAPEEREHLLDLAHQWRAMATTPRIYEFLLRDAHRSAVTAWLRSAVGLNEGMWIGCYLQHRRVGRRSPA